MLGPSLHYHPTHSFLPHSWLCWQTPPRQLSPARPMLCTQQAFPLSLHTQLALQGAFLWTLAQSTTYQTAMGPPHAHQSSWLPSIRSARTSFAIPLPSIPEGGDHVDTVSFAAQTVYPTVVTTVSAHGLTTGDMVTFCKVQGLDGLNDIAPVPVTVTGPCELQPRSAE